VELRKKFLLNCEKQLCSLEASAWPQRPPKKLLLLVLQYTAVNAAEIWRLAMRCWVGSCKERNSLFSHFVIFI
jgi:hypothetical protein